MKNRNKNKKIIIITTTLLFLIILSLIIFSAGNHYIFPAEKYVVVYVSKTVEEFTTNLKEKTSQGKYFVITPEMLKGISTISLNLKGRETIRVEKRIFPVVLIDGEVKKFDFLYFKKKEVLFPIRIRTVDGEYHIYKTGGENLLKEIKEKEKEIKKKEEEIKKKEEEIKKKEEEIKKMRRKIRKQGEKYEALLFKLKEKMIKLEIENERNKKEIKIEKKGDICYVYSGKYPLESVLKGGEGKFYLLKWVPKKKLYWGQKTDTLIFEIKFGDRGDRRIRVKIDFKNKRIKATYKGGVYEAKELHMPEPLIERFRVISRGD